MKLFLAYLLFLLFPSILLYLGWLFITWGSGWYPGDWSSDARVLISLIFGAWLITVTATFIS